jgi:hypothetical protein
MGLLRLLLAGLVATAGLVLFTAAPASACSCAALGTEKLVDAADTVFLGTLASVEEPPPDDDGTIGSDDPVSYTFDVEQTFTGDAGDGVVESARLGASCGLEGMRVGTTYVVFAGEGDDGLGASLCGGTAQAADRLLERVGAAVATEPPTGTPAPERAPVPVPVPTEVPSGLDRVADDGPLPSWAWFLGGVGLSISGGAAAVRWRLLRP